MHDEDSGRGYVFIGMFSSRRLIFVSFGILFPSIFFAFSTLALSSFLILICLVREKMATSLHSYYEEIDQILGTLGCIMPTCCAYMLWWRVEEVDPQHLMLMSLLLRGVRVRGRPE